MKDKRNCGVPYPVYPNPLMSPGYPPMNPNMGYQMNPSMGYPSGVSSNAIEQQINNIEQQINLLDQRISRLENLNNTTNNNYNKYNDSNYYMV